MLDETTQWSIVLIPLLSFPFMFLTQFKGGKSHGIHTKKAQLYAKSCIEVPSLYPYGHIS